MELAPEDKLHCGVERVWGKSMASLTETPLYQATTPDVKWKDGMKVT